MTILVAYGCALSAASSGLENILIEYMSLAIYQAEGKCGCQWLLDSGEIVSICPDHGVRTLNEHLDSLICEHAGGYVVKDHGGRDRCSVCWKVRKK